MSATEKPVDPDAEELAKELSAGVLESLSMMVDKDITLSSQTVSASPGPPTGKDNVHIAFRFKAISPLGERFVCLLLPLDAAVSGACSVLMMPLDQVPGICSSGFLEPAIKEALLEIGNMLSSVFAQRLSEPGSKCSVSFHGCQGLRADRMAWVPLNNPEGWIHLEGEGVWEDVGKFRFGLGHAAA